MKLVNSQVKSIKLAALLLLSAFAGHAVADQSVDRRIWDYTPIKITLTVGEEKKIHFPEGSRVRVWRPSRLEKKLRHQSVEHVVYWKAIDEFEEARITVQELEPNSGYTYLIDLKAEKNAKGAKNVEIVRRTPTNNANNSSEEQSQTSVVNNNRIEPRALTRYASQSLYAPKRIVATIDERIPGIQQVNAPTETLYKLYQSGVVSARPIAAWKSESLYVTAVELRNVTEQVVPLDPRKIRGTFKTSVFQHNPPVLGPKGHPKDTTTIYLVSAMPFEESTRYVQRVDRPKAIRLPAEKSTEVTTDSEEE